MVRKKTDLEKLEYQIEKLNQKYLNVILPCPNKCPSEEMRNTRKGCCCHCARDSGYFTITFEDINDNDPKLIDQRHQLQKLKEKYNFTNEDGFLQVGVGCKLPRGERSIICNEYQCYGFTMTRNEYVFPGDTIKKIKSLKKKIGLIY